MKTGELISFVAIAVCLTVLMLPDQRTDANLRRVFAERGLELISIEPSSGCNRVGAYRYALRTRAGEIEHGLLCINKSLRVFEMRQLPG